MSNSRNPDSGNMETGIPERKPPLIGLINTHKESNVKPRAALRCEAGFTIELKLIN